MKVYKKIFAVIMSLTMMLSYMPALAFAEDGTESDVPQAAEEVLDNEVPETADDADGQSAVSDDAGKVLRDAAAEAGESSGESADQGLMSVEGEDETIGLDETKTVKIENAGDSVRFVFTPAESGWYSFSSNGGFDTYGFVLDADEINLAYNDDGGENRNFNVVFEADAGQSYFLKANMYEPSDTGEFSVTVTATEEPQPEIGRWGGTEVDGGKITIGNTYEVIIENSRDYYSYEFKPDKGGWYSFMSGGSEDTYGRILDSDGEELYSNDDGDNNSDYNFEIIFEAEAGETYYLQACMLDSSTGEFTVQVTETTEPSGGGGDDDDEWYINYIYSSYKDGRLFTATAELGDYDGEGTLTGYWYRTESGQIIDEDSDNPIATSEVVYDDEDKEWISSAELPVQWPTFRLVVIKRDADGNTVSQRTRDYNNNNTYIPAYTVTFVPAEPVVLTYHRGGSYYTDYSYEDGVVSGRYYKYTFPGFKEGDKFVFTEEGTDVTKEYIYEVPADDESYSAKFRNPDDPENIYIRAYKSDVKQSDTTDWTPDTDQKFIIEADLIEETDEYSYVSTDYSVECPVRVASDPDAPLYSYELESGHARLTDYSGDEKTVTVPSEIDGYTVQEIGENLFANRSMTSLTIPDSVTNIGEGAFDGCRSLSNVKLGSGITTIDKYAFARCSSLESIDLPSALKNIGTGAFYGCSNIRRFDLPDSVTSIGSRAFDRCEALSYFKYPASLSSTGGNLFVNDANLTSISVPAGVTSLASEVFEGSKYLTSVELPSSLQTIGSYAFRNCTGLTGVNLPAGLKTIRYYAFYGCTGIKSFDLPDGITNIGEYAFGGIPDLESINYPLSLSTTGGYLFTDSAKIKEFTIPDGVTSLASGFFGSNKYIAKVNLPEGLKKIGSDAFENCTGITEMTIPDSVEEIGYRAFSGCTNLRSVNFPSSLNKAGTYIFSGCTKLKSITVPEGVTVLPDYAFSYDDCLETVILPASLEKIGAYAFNDCSKLRTINIPEGVYSIGKDAFYYCESLKKVTIPASSTAIPAMVFGNCKALTDVWIGQQITSIADDAFYNCSTDTLVIHGVEGSYAQEWAEGKGYTFSTEEIVSTEGQISGTVTDKDGKGIGGIGVTVYDVLEAVIIYSGVTGSDGTWSTSDATTGRQYTVNYAASNYTFSDNDIRVLAEEFTSVDTVTAEKVISDTEASDPADFTYEVVSGTTIRITGYTGSSDTVSIPSEIAGNTVVSIGSEAFRNSNLKTVIIPEGVTGIENRAFYGSDSLENVMFPSTLTSIGNYAFSGCRAIKSIDLPFGLTTIGSSAFSGCTGISEIKLPDSVTTIGDDAFYNCSELISVNYPRSLTKGGGGFLQGTKVTEITVPEGVTKIAVSAFGGCAGLVTVNLPDSLNEIGSSAFYGCTGIKTITLPANVTKVGYSAFENCTSLTEIGLPEGLQTIEYDAFYGCSGLTEVHLPDSVKTIDRDAFSRCSNLETVNYPLSLESCSSGPFTNDPKLTSITIPEGVTKVAPYVFQNCTSLENVVFPSTVTEIGSYSFSGCAGLKAVILPEALEKIGQYAFSSCTGLTTLIIPDPVTSLGAYALAYCTNLENVNYPASLETTGGRVFYGDTKLTEITVPEGVTVLAQSVFSSAGNLKTVNLPSTLTTIGQSAFEKCSAIEELTIPSGVTALGTYAFRECTSLTKMTIPEGVTAISYGCFYGCSNLQEVVLPDTITTIAAYAFYNCTELETWNYPKALESVSSPLFNSSQKMKEIVVPDGVTSLPQEAFSGCRYLTNVRMPDSLKEIKASAFYGCTGLTSLAIPDSVETIGRSAFYGCTNLASLNYPKSLKNCDEYTYYNCTNLKTMTVPEGVTELPANAFSYANCLVAVNLPDTLTSIGDSAFYMCSKLKRVRVPDSVTNITQHAFNNCKALVKFIVPAGTTALNYRTFRDCTSLEDIWIGEQVTSIDNNAFYGCSTDKLLIHGVPGSTAEAFASAKGFRFTANEVFISDNLLGGSVVDKDGKGIEGVGVRIFDDSTKTLVFSTYTDADGRWECEELKFGLSYIVSYARSNFTFSSNNILITAGEDEELEPVTAEQIISDVEAAPGTDFTYNVLNANDISITGYKGSSKVVAIPETIDDYKVVRIAEYAFRNSSVETLIVPESVTAIESYAFSYCSTLKKVMLPSCITAIPGSAFYNCTSLQDTGINYGITSIGSSAYSGCSALTSVEFPETLKSIGYAAFRDCTSLADFNYPVNVTSAGGSIFSGDPKIREITVPEGTKTVTGSLFSYSEYVTSVNLPDGLLEIGQGAFRGCSSLKKIAIPDSVEVLGSSAFSGCTSLESANYPKSLRSINREFNSGSVFYNTPKLKTVTIPNGVTKIVDYAFDYCNTITEITLPETVQTIGYASFEDCSALTTIMMSKSLTSIGNYAFNNATALKYVAYPGTEAEWKAVSIGSNNVPLINATIIFGDGGEVSILPPEQPVITGAAHGHKQIQLQWNYTGVQSLVKRFVLQRSSNGLDYTTIRNLDASTFSHLDTVTFTGASRKFYYRIAIIDKYDRSATSEPISVTAVSTDTEAPVAVINPSKNALARTNQDCSFSGAMSTDNDGIVSYKWAFGDGTKAEGQNVTHKFTRSGTFDVTLTVTDESGNTGTSSVQYTVVDRDDPNYTMLTFKVVDASSEDSKPVKGAVLSLTKDDQSADTFAVDSNGQYSLLVRNGAYNVTASANGYLIRTVKIIAEGGDKEHVIGLSTKSTWSATLSATEMTMDEIVAAGIDVNAPGNQHVWKFKNTFTFVAGLQTYEFPLEIFKNENGVVEKTSGGGFHIIPNPSGGGGGKLRIGIFPITEKFTLVIYGEAHWVKEMYKVELVVNNDSTTDTLEDIHAELKLPEGLSLADMINGVQTAEKDLGSLGHKESTATEWYVRGDKEGEYNLSATVTATEMPYGEVSVKEFTTASPIKVYAGSALHLTIECEDQATRGGDYTVKYKLENVSDKSLYNVSFGITRTEQYKLLTLTLHDQERVASLPLDDYDFGKDFTYEVAELAPGGYIEMDFTTTIWFNSALELIAFSKVGSFVDVAYYLTDVSLVTLEKESTTEVPYDIVVKRAERPYLIDKVISELVKKFLKDNDVELPGGDLGGTIIELSEELAEEASEKYGKDYIGIPKGASTWLKLAQGQSNYKLVVEIDDGRGDTDSIYNGSIRITAGTPEEAVVDYLNNNKLKVGTDGVVITYTGPGTSKVKIGVENSFGKQEMEYIIDVVAEDKETKSSLKFEKDGVTGTYKSEADNFESTIKAHKELELSEYIKNPYQTLDSSVVIDISGHTEDTKYTVELSEKQLSDLLGETTISSLDVKGRAANVSYSREALTTISTKGGNVSLSVEKLSQKDREALGTTNPVYKFTATTTADPRWDFSGGPVRVTVPYEIIGEENQKNVSVKHIREDGSTEMLDAVYDTSSKTITFETNSFSYFEIIGNGFDATEGTEIVAGLIKDLPDAGSLTINDKAKVKEAMDAYNKLPVSARETMSKEDVDKLMAAAKRMEALEKAEQARLREQALIKANNGRLDAKLPKVTISKPTAGKKKMTAKWKKVSKKNQKKIKGIEVEYSTDKSFKTAYKFKTGSKKKTSVVIKKLKSKKTYYVRAHTYVVRGGVKYVSPWSKVKKVKIK